MHAKLAPMQIGRKGNLQEWLEDWDETGKEPSPYFRSLGPLSRPPNLAAHDAEARRGEPGCARATRITGKRMVFGVEGGLLGSPW